MSTTFAPCLAAEIAVSIPPSPPPTTHKSQSCVIFNLIQIIIFLLYVS